MSQQRCKGYVATFKALLVEEDVRCTSVHYFKYKLVLEFNHWKNSRWFDSRHFRILDSVMWGSYPTSLRNVDGSTRASAYAWNNAGKSQYNLYVVGVT